MFFFRKIVWRLVTQRSKYVGFRRNDFPMQHHGIKMNAKGVQILRLHITTVLSHYETTTTTFTCYSFPIYNYVSVTCRYWQLPLDKVPSTNSRQSWDRSVHEASEIYKERMVCPCFLYPILNLSNTLNLKKFLETLGNIESILEHFIIWNSF